MEDSAKPSVNTVANGGYLPLSITLRHRLYPEITILYLKEKKIIFQTPPYFKGITVDNIFEASFQVSKQMTFPYSDWELIPANKYWSVWLYEKKVSEILKQKQKIPESVLILNNAVETQFQIDKINTGVQAASSTSLSSLASSSVESKVKISTNTDSNGDGDGDGDGDEEEQSPINPVEVEPDKWNSKLVSKWIDSNQKPALKLKEITHYRRYGLGRCFEFLCIWYINDLKTASTWLKYNDLIRVDEYEEYLTARWDIKTEEISNWEEFEPLADLTMETSGGEEEKDNGGSLFGSAYILDDGSKKSLKLLEPEKKETKSKRKPGKGKKLKPKRKFTQERLHGGSPVVCEDWDESEGDSNDESDTEMNPSHGTSRKPHQISRDKMNSYEEEEDFEEENSDDEKLKESKQFHRAENTKWEYIFGMSSVSPVPRFAIKKFKKY